MSTKILLVDDHQMVLDGLSALIQIMPGFSVCGKAKNGWELIEQLETQEYPDIILMDISMPELDGIETMEKLVEKDINVAVIIMSMHLSSTFARRLFSLGTRGYLQKDCDHDELRRALEDVRDGGTYLSKNMTELLVADPRTSPEAGATARPKLSPRELEILILLQQEKSSREIAEVLGITFHTVETHRKHLLNKFAVGSTIGLIREAMRNGLLE